MIPSTDPDQVATRDPESFRSFLKAYESLGGRIDEVSVTLIQESINKNGITVRQLADGLREAFEKEHRITWAAVFKYATDIWDRDNSIYRRLDGNGE